MIFWPGFAVRLSITGRSGGKCRKMKSNGFARLDEAWMRKVSSTRSTWAPASRAGNPGVRYHGQSGKSAGKYWPTRPMSARTTGPPCAVATVTGSCEQPPVIAPPSSTPAGPGTTRGQADLQMPLDGLRNAYATIKLPPDSSGWTKQNAQLALAVIGQNKQDHPQPANTSNRIKPDH